MTVRTRAVLLLVVMLGGLTTACGTAAGSLSEREVRGVTTGICSYVASSLDGNRTANGEIYDETKLTAAHRSYAFGTRLRVTNLNNGNQVVVRVNDRGPFVEGRVLDVSLEAARRLDFVERGITRVRIEVLESEG